MENMASAFRKAFTDYTDNTNDTALLMENIEGLIGLLQDLQEISVYTVDAAIEASSHSKDKNLTTLAKVCSRIVAHSDQINIWEMCLSSLV